MDQNGVIQLSHSGTGRYEDTEKVIQKLLAKKRWEISTSAQRENDCTVLGAAFLCAFVSLCLCVSAEAQLFPKTRRDTGPKPKNIHGVVQDLRGKAVVGARVFMKDMKTNVVRTLETDQTGAYSVYCPDADRRLRALCRIQRQDLGQKIRQFIS